MTRYIALFCLCLWGNITFGLGGMVVRADAMRWSRAVVPYVIDTQFSPAQRAEILAAMALWEAETVVQFVPFAPGMADYVFFKPSTGRQCASSVGRQGGMQLLTLAPRCGTMLITHELGHLLGLWHEQARLDRDAYVEVIWENIKPDHRHNFDKRTVEGQNQGPYDYDSIMHYSADAFSQNGKPTLRARASGVQIGQRTHLSRGDVAAINALYASEFNEE